MCDGFSILLYLPENGQKLQTAENRWFGGLKNECATKNSEKDLPLRLSWKILKS